MFSRRFTILLAVVTMAFGFTSCTHKGASKNSSEILIGEYGSMTGGDATFGQSTHHGIALALKEINAAGGVLGKKLKLISYDDEGKSEEAATVVTKLITQDNVVAVLGEVASTRSLFAAPIAQQYKVPMVSPSSTNPKVTQVGDYIFRVCFIDPFQGTVMAKFAANNLKLKRVAIMRDVKSDYSEGLTKYFTDAFTKLGGKIVSEQTYQGQQDVDFKAQLTAIKSTQPEGIFVPGYYGEAALIARQARELGMKAVFMGGDGWDSPELYRIGKDAVIGAYFSNHYASDSKDPVAKEFNEHFKKEYGIPADGLSAMGYDALKVVADAIKRAGSDDPKKIRDALATTKDFQGVTGKITIDADRNARKSAVVVKVMGESDNRFVTSINPD